MNEKLAQALWSEVPGSSCRTRTEGGLVGEKFMRPTLKKRHLFIKEDPDVLVLIKEG